MRKIVVVAFALICALSANSRSQTPTWERTHGPSGAGLYDIEIDSTGDLYLFSNQTYRSSNGGTDWTQLPASFGDLHVLPNNKLVALKDGSVVLSTDQGTSWSTILSSSGSLATTIAGKIYLLSGTRVFRTSNEGATWDTLALAPEQGHLSCFQSSTLFLLSDGRTATYPMYRSTDDGESWTKVINGISFDSYYGEDMAGGAGGLTAYVSREGGYVSSDDGRTWKALVHGPTNIVNPHIAITRDRSIVVFYYNVDVFNSAGERIGPGSAPYGGVGKAVNAINGTLWSTTGPDAANFSITGSQPRYYPIPTGSVTAMTAFRQGHVVSVTNGSVNGTGDGGDSWRHLAGMNFVALAFDSTHNAIGANGSFVYRSTDSGSSWKQLGSSLASQITSIVVDRSGWIYAGTGDGVFISTDSGITWDQFKSGLTNPSVLALALSPSGTLFASTWTGMFSSSNQGKSWTLLPAALIQRDTSGAVRPTKFGATVINEVGDILTVVNDTAIYVSHDNGQSWSPTTRAIGGHVNALLSMPIGYVFAATDAGAFYLTAGTSNWISSPVEVGPVRVLSLARDEVGRVFLGTDGFGMFRSMQTFNIANSNVVSTSATPASFVVYPNPVGSNGTLQIECDPATAAEAQLIDLLGVRHAVVLNRRGPDGKLELHLPSDLVNGVYRLLLGSPSGFTSQNIVVAR